MPVRIGRMIEIGELIKVAEAQGCEFRESKGKLATPWGDRTIRFLYNPTSRGRYDITDYDAGESMLESEIQSVERRLGIKVPG